MRLRVSEVVRLLQQQQKSAPLLLFLGVLPQAALLQEPQGASAAWPPDLMKVPRAKVRRAQTPPL